MVVIRTPPVNPRPSHTVNPGSAVLTFRIARDPGANMPSSAPEPGCAGSVA